MCLLVLWAWNPPDYWVTLYTWFLCFTFTICSTLTCHSDGCCVMGRCPPSDPGWFYPPRCPGARWGICRGSPALGLKSPRAARLVSAPVWTADGSLVPVSQTGVERQRRCCRGSPMESCGRLMVAQALDGLLRQSGSHGCCNVKWQKIMLQ